MDSVRIEMSRLQKANGINQLKTTRRIQRNGWEIEESVLVSDNDGHMTLAWDTGYPYPMVYATAADASRESIETARTCVERGFDTVMPTAGVCTHEPSRPIREAYFRQHPARGLGNVNAEASPTVA